MSNASVVMQLPPPSQATLQAPLPSTSSSSVAGVPLSNVHPAHGSRKRQDSTVRPTQRNSENASPSPPAHPVRRIRPLGPITPSAHSNTASPILVSCDDLAMDKQKDWKKSPGWRATSGAQQQQLLEFPPKNVMLHPEDASNKVFIAIGRAFMSVVSANQPLSFVAQTKAWCPLTVLHPHFRPCFCLVRGSRKGEMRLRFSHAHCNGSFHHCDSSFSNLGSFSRVHYF